uniref:A-kinase anchor protein 7 RI-RII subunit-binding domain-containing protein n=1 Tax=Mola mola TaxID=94237 RepID=A0A3Q3WX17_MOLML
MGQLCCFPFSQAEEKISWRPRSEPDEAELQRVSRRLVEDAVNRALQQYKQETLHNGASKTPIGGQRVMSTANNKEV